MKFKTEIAADKAQYPKDVQMTPAEKARYDQGYDHGASFASSLYEKFSLPTMTFEPEIKISDDFTVNYELCTVKVKADGKEIEVTNLTRIEFKIFSTLIRNFKRGHLHRSELVKAIWGDVSTSPRNIDTHICHLREKIEPTGLKIKNKRETGYFLLKPEKGLPGARNSK